MKFRIYYKRRISGYYKVAWTKEVKEVEAESLDQAIENATKGYEIKWGSVQYEEIK